MLAEAKNDLGTCRPFLKLKFVPEKKNLGHLHEILRKKIFVPKS
jgi:hypothetical protein